MHHAQEELTVVSNVRPCFFVAGSCFYADVRFGRSRLGRFCRRSTGFDTLGMDT